MIQSIKEWFCGTEYTIGVPYRWYRRFILFPYQRVTRGFDDSVVWDLQDDIAKFTLPRLRYFKEQMHGHPAHMEWEEWNEILDKMIWSLEYSMRSCGEDDNYLPEELHFVDRDYDLMSVNWTVLQEDGTTTKFKVIDPPETVEERVAFEDKWNRRMEAEKALDARCAEGLELFGKYFRALWS